VGTSSKGIATALLVVASVLSLSIAGAAAAATTGTDGASGGIVPVPVVGSPARATPAPAAPQQVSGAVGQLSFVSDNQGVPNVMHVDADGTDRGALTDCPATKCPLGTGAPAYSPDGTQIVFVKGWDAAGQGAVDTMTSGGKSEAQLGTLVGETPDWSPDGAQIAFAWNADATNEDIYVANADGSGTPVNVTNDVAGADLHPAWSPDGTTIAYVAPGAGGLNDVYAIPAGGGTPVNLTNTDAVAEAHPAYSPDGTQLAFDDGAGGISVVAAAGGTPVQLAANGENPAWAPDGSMLAFDSDRDGLPQIYTMLADGSSQTRLLNEPYNDTDPAWQSYQVTVSVTPTTIDYKKSVTVTAHLAVASSTTNLTVSIYKIPYGGPSYLVKSGTVDGNGDFTTTVVVYKLTTFWTTWDGDASHFGSKSSTQDVKVHAITTGTLTGYYSTSHGVRLYHYTSACTHSPYTGCPVYTVVVTPDHQGQNVDFTMQQQQSNGTWKFFSSFTFALGSGSQIVVKLTYTNSGVIGQTFRIKANFPGDADHLGDETKWADFKITN
jgi:Tol biopolymer transport system component